jgi:ferredoxin
MCVGADRCVLSEPAVFDRDDDGLIELLAEAPEGQTAKTARRAIGLCPSGALSLVE